MTTGQTDTPRCADGCKRPVPDSQDPALGSWQYLEITRRWRCPACHQALMEANGRTPPKED